MSSAPGWLASGGGSQPLLVPTGGDYFCANPRCVLHVREGDVGVHGRGNWAQLPHGRWASRSRYGEVMLCNDCGRAWLAGDLTLAPS